MHLSLMMTKIIFQTIKKKISSSECSIWLDKGAIVCSFFHEETRQVCERGQGKKNGRQIIYRLIFIYDFVWSCGESNSGPNMQHNCFLHAYSLLMIRTLAKQGHIRQIPESLLSQQGFGTKPHAAPHLRCPYQNAARQSFLEDSTALNRID